MKSLQIVYDKIKIKDLNNIDASKDIEELFARLDSFMKQVEQSNQYKDFEKHQQEIIDEYNKIGFIDQQTKLITLCRYCLDLINTEDIKQNDFFIISTMFDYLRSETKKNSKIDLDTHTDEEQLCKFQNYTQVKLYSIFKNLLYKVHLNICEGDYDTALLIENDISILLVCID